MWYHALKELTDMSLFGNDQRGDDALGGASCNPKNVFGLAILVVPFKHCTVHYLSQKPPSSQDWMALGELRFLLFPTLETCSSSLGMRRHESISFG